jgi:hypothetical protein
MGRSLNLNDLHVESFATEGYGAEEMRAQAATNFGEWTCGNTCPVTECNCGSQGTTCAYTYCAMDHTCGWNCEGLTAGPEAECGGATAYITCAQGCRKTTE